MPARPGPHVRTSGSDLDLDLGCHHMEPVEKTACSDRDHTTLPSRSRRGRAPYHLPGGRFSGFAGMGSH